MFSGLEVFKTASALASHATARQTAISENIANADTPKYHAKDLEPFSELYGNTGPSMALRVTRPRHIQISDQGFMPFLQEVERPGDESPNGNTVSLETEMVNAAEVKFSHDMALTVYRSGMTLLRSSLGSRS